MRNFALTLGLATALLASGGCVSLFTASMAATVENRPYFKAGTVAADVTADRFACKRAEPGYSYADEWKLGAEARKAANERLDACMRTKGYSVSR